VREAGVPASEIAYVGDRLDNDVFPAIEAEMFGIFIPRGPWGRQHDHWPDRSRASAVVSSLSELSGVLETLGR
jgi:FMN phosphatase YigB (HAD superfamily)